MDFQVSAHGLCIISGAFSTHNLCHLTVWNIEKLYKVSNRFSRYKKPLTRRAFIYIFEKCVQMKTLQFTKRDFDHFLEKNVSVSFFILIKENKKACLKRTLDLGQCISIVLKLCPFFDTKH